MMSMKRFLLGNASRSTPLSKNGMHLERPSGTTKLPPSPPSILFALPVKRNLVEKKINM
jgi:hypothetical protein